jgi:hypothetical protein
MKTICITAVLLLAATLSFAQQNRVLFGVESGIGLADISFSLGNTDTDDWYESRLGFAAGITFRYKFSEIASLCSGLSYELKGSSSDVTFTDVNGNITGRTTIKDNYNYLVVPLMLRMAYGKKLNIYTNLGPYLGILLKRKLVFENAIYLSNGEIVKSIDATDDTEPVEFGVSLGIGFSTALNEKMILSFEVRDNKGITDTNPYDADITTNSLLFFVGAAFKLDSGNKDLEKK